VEESGVGIEDKERVFEALYWENKEKEGIHLEGEKGKGSRFHLCGSLNP
jgi:hypothetical protein